MPDRSKFIVIILALFALILAGCQLSLLPEQTDARKAEGLQERSSEDTGGGGHDATAKQPSPRFKIPLKRVEEGVSLTASEVFAQVAPAIAFVETPTASGSGIWIEPRFLVSNAHVVWPYDAVRVVFPNGEEHLDVPVIAWDLVADLAVLGPIETDVAPVPFADSSNLQVGEDIFLIGYPGEMEKFPQPTLTQGLLSRIRHWDTIDLSFFQVDAAIAGGQSGGALVTGSGDIVGISTYSFTEAGFGLVASAADFLDRLESLVNNGEPESVITRRIGRGSGSKSYLIQLRDREARKYILLTEKTEEVEIVATGRNPVELAASSFYGYDYYEAKKRDGSSKLSFTAEEGVPYLVEVWDEFPIGVAYHLESNVRLISLDDPDDGKKIKLDKVYLGNIDFPSDVDTYKMRLDEGETIEVVADSLSIDPYLTVSYETNKIAETYEDDDSGGGFFGTNSRLLFRAPQKATYTIEVYDAYFDRNIGGYFLTVRKADDGEQLAEPSSVRTFEGSLYGKMELYESDTSNFQIFFPALWERSYECGDATACYQGSAGIFMVLEEEMGDIGYTDIDLEEYADLVVENIDKSTSGFELLERETITTSQDLTAVKLTFTTFSGHVKAVRLVYVDESGHVFNAMYITDTPLFNDLVNLFDYSLATFRVVDAQ